MARADPTPWMWCSLMPNSPVTSPLIAPMSWPGGMAWCLCSALASGRRGGCSPPGPPVLIGCRSGSPARRSRPLSFRRSWTKRTWARRSPTLPGPRGSGCSTAWPGEFRRGRLFLAGDAAHAYSPATGQGMNAAIQDAANLGWKLAFGASQPESAALLDSYDAERRPVAHQVLGMTHLVFWGEAATGLIPALLRSQLLPLRRSGHPRAHETPPPGRRGESGCCRSCGSRYRGQSRCRWRERRTLAKQTPRRETGYPIDRHVRRTQYPACTSCSPGQACTCSWTATQTCPTPCRWGRWSTSTASPAAPAAACSLSAPTATSACAARQPSQAS